MIRPMMHIFPKSLMEGTVELRRETNPAWVTIRATATGRATWFVVLTAACTRGTPFFNSSSMRLWN